MKISKKKRFVKRFFEGLGVEIKETPAKSLSEILEEVRAFLRVVKWFLVLGRKIKKKIKKNRKKHQNLSRSA